MKKKGKGKPRGMNYADVLKARRDRLQLEEVDDDYAFEKLRLRAEDVSRMDIRYYGKLKID